MRQVAAACILALVATVITGCESWAKSGQSNLLIKSIDAQRMGYAPGWASSIALRNGQKIKSAAVLDDLIVFLETPRNYVTAISAVDGDFKWRLQIGGPGDLLYGPHRIGKEVYVNSETQFFKIDTEFGKLIELQDLRHPVRTAPAIANDLAIFGAANGRIFAHKIVSGLPKWEYSLTSQIRVAPVLTTVDVFAADSGGVYAMLEIDSGTLSWRSRTHGPVNGQPVANRLSVLVPCDDGSLYAIDRTTGRDQWIYRTRQPLRVEPIAIDAQVFLLLDKAMVALDAQTGKDLWIREDMAKPILRRGDQLLMSTGTGIELADMATGKTAEAAPTTPLRTVLTGPDGSIFLVSTRGDVQQLTLRK